MAYLLQDGNHNPPLVALDAVCIEAIFGDVEIERRQRDVHEIIKGMDYFAGDASDDQYFFACNERLSYLLGNYMIYILLRQFALGCIIRA